MTSGAALATRATPPDLIEDAGDRAAPEPAEAAKRPGGADASRQPHAMPLPASDGRRDRAGAPVRPAPAGEAVSERYLAPAMKAAAAARARSARIRADAAAVSAPRDAGPADRSLPPAPAARYGWSVSEKVAAAPVRAPAPAAGGRCGGLSVAAAARASTIAFQPVRRPAPRGAPADLPAPAELPAPADRPGPADLPAPAALRARAPEPGPPPAPAQPVAAEPARGSGAEAQRFARTVAELERSLAANRSHEAGSGLVPRPTLPLVDPEPSGRAWLRLWSRR